MIVGNGCAYRLGDTNLISVQSSSPLTFLFCFLNLGQFETLNPPRKERRWQSPSGNEVNLGQSLIYKFESEVRRLTPSGNEVKLGQLQINKCDREMRWPTSSDSKGNLGHPPILNPNSEVSWPIPSMLTKFGQSVRSKSSRVVIYFKLFGKYSILGMSRRERLRRLPSSFQYSTLSSSSPTKWEEDICRFLQCCMLRDSTSFILQNKSCGKNSRSIF